MAVNSTLVNIVAGGTVAFESELAGAMESSGYVDTVSISMAVV
jgi:hypothetical protein